MRRAILVSIVAIAVGFSTAALASAARAQIGVGISVRVGPPPLPVYAQPYCPGPNYIWTPGYWGWGPGGYYWVPGTWVLAPRPGLLWTPGWWGFAGGAYLWHPGYWGPHVGFYGGINYGFGYFGNGFVGGEWRGGRFFYNTAVSRVNARLIHDVYVNRNYQRMTAGRVAFNGGPHGVNARPTAEQQRWDREQHFGRTPAQDRHISAAQNNRAYHYSENHGRPPVGATQRPNQFHAPANENRSRGNYQERTNNRSNNRGREDRNFAQPRNQQRGNRPEAQRKERAPRGNEGRSRNEQPRGNPGGERGHAGGGHEGGDRGHDHGR